MGVTPERAKEMLRSKETLRSPGLPPQRAGPRSASDDIAALRSEVAGLRKEVNELRDKVLKLDDESGDHAVLLREKGLSPRQSTILSLLVTGMSNPEIADALHLSNNTVRTHMAQMASRMGTGNRVVMAVRAVQWGLVDVDEPDGSANEVPGDSGPGDGQDTRV